MHTLRVRFTCPNLQGATTSLSRDDVTATRELHSLADRQTLRLIDVRSTAQVQRTHHEMRLRMLVSCVRGAHLIDPIALIAFCNQSR